MPSALAASAAALAWATPSPAASCGSAWIFVTDESVVHGAWGPTQIGSSFQPWPVTDRTHEEVRFGCEHATVRTTDVDAHAGVRRRLLPRRHRRGRRRRAGIETLRDRGYGCRAGGGGGGRRRSGLGGQTRGQHDGEPGDEDDSERFIAPPPGTTGGSVAHRCRRRCRRSSPPTRLPGTWPRAGW